MRIIVIGGGGHGEVVADILRMSARAGGAGEFAGYVDDRKTMVGVDRVLGDIDALAGIPHDAVIVAIGDNAVRARLSERLHRLGERMAVACHPTAIVADAVSIGAGTMIAAGVIVSTGARLGRGVIVNTGSSVDHHCVIGNYAHIGPGALLGGEVSVGDRALVGVGAIVLPRITIGAGAIVGAGAVVTRNVPPAATVVGNPARRLELVA